ncbi:hypothetical protein ACLMJK_007183 [Lecanora helva]
MSTVITGVPALSSAELEANAQQAQLEALGLNRRNVLSTREFKEKRAEFVPLGGIQRRVDEAGTEENRLAAQSGVRQQLTAWSAAWQDLKDDGTNDEGLQDVNEGTGQTHRGKLQQDADVKDYKPDDDDLYQRNRSSHSFRGGRSRGGGLRVVRKPKRPRVVKGSQPNAPPTRLNEASSKKLSSSTAAGSSRQPVINGQTSSTNGVPSSALPNQAVPQAQARKLSKIRPSYTGQLGTPDEFMASIQDRVKVQPLSATGQSPPLAYSGPESNDIKNSVAAPTATAVHHSTNTPQPSLMDFGSSDEIVDRPVLAFTDPSDSAALIAPLHQPLAPQSLAQGTGTRPDPVRSESTTSEKMYSLDNLLALRSRSSSGSSAKSDKMVTFLGSQMPQGCLISESPDPTPPAPAEPRISEVVALQRAAERQFLIGEHVHRSAFQRNRLLDSRVSYETAPASVGSVSVGGGAGSRDRTGSPEPISRGRGALSEYNGQLRSFTPAKKAPRLPDTSSTNSKPRVSKFNQTGFIGLAENQAWEKGK